MSDGPYRSLPLGRPWKKVGEVACNSAFSLTEVEEKIRFARKRDFVDAPVTKVVGILLNGIKDRLIADDEGTIGKLQDLKKKLPVTPVNELVVDCAIEAARRGLCEEKDAENAVADALEIWTSRHLRSVEEHGHRSPKLKEASGIEQRIRQAARLLDAASDVADLLSGKGSRKKLVQPTKNTGLDGGVALPNPRVK